jgi:hypothetical protein
MIGWEVNGRVGLSRFAGMLRRASVLRRVGAGVPIAFALLAQDFRSLRPTLTPKRNFVHTRG